MIQYQPFKRGDTPIFEFRFNAPIDGFDWGPVTIDVALTDEKAPKDNSKAGAVRINQPLDVNPDDNSASFIMQLTPTESKALKPNTNYNIEAQLKQDSAEVATVITGRVRVEQDYVI